MGRSGWPPRGSSGVPVLHRQPEVLQQGSLEDSSTKRGQAPRRGSDDRSIQRQPRSLRGAGSLVQHGLARPPLRSTKPAAAAVPLGSPRHLRDRIALEMGIGSLRSLQRSMSLIRYICRLTYTICDSRVRSLAIEYEQQLDRQRKPPSNEETRSPRPWSWDRTRRRWQPRLDVAAHDRAQLVIWTEWTEIRREMRSIGQPERASSRPRSHAD